jgi:hypothetical protein
MSYSNIALIKASNGKSASVGGLNLKAIKKYLDDRGIKYVSSSRTNLQSALKSFLATVTNEYMIEDEKKRYQLQAELEAVNKELEVVAIRKREEQLVKEKEMRLIEEEMKAREKANVKNKKDQEDSALLQYTLDSKRKKLSKYNIIPVLQVELLEYFSINEIVYMLKYKQLDVDLIDVFSSRQILVAKLNTYLGKNNKILDTHLSTLLKNFIAKYTDSKHITYGSEKYLTYEEQYFSSSEDDLYILLYFYQLLKSSIKPSYVNPINTSLLKKAISIKDINLLKFMINNGIKIDRFITTIISLENNTSKMLKWLFQVLHLKWEDVETLKNSFGSIKFVIWLYDYSDTVGKRNDFYKLTLDKAIEYDKNTLNNFIISKLTTDCKFLSCNDKIDILVAVFGYEDPTEDIEFMFDLIRVFDLNMFKIAFQVYISTFTVPEIEKVYSCSCYSNSYHDPDGVSIVQIREELHTAYQYIILQFETKEFKNETTSQINRIKSK